jgi:hypothetical protein
MKIDKLWYDTDTRAWVEKTRVQGGKQKKQYPSPVIFRLNWGIMFAGQVDLSHMIDTIHNGRLFFVHQWRGGELESTVHPRRHRV